MPALSSKTAIAETFARALPTDERAIARTLFGSPCCFVNGNMFAGAHREELFLRLPVDQRGRFLRQSGARVFEPIAGRPMREYVSVPSTMLENRRQLRGWVKRAFDYALTLPVKR
ncbi:MAG: TfoX family protein [Myxococcales bacterium]|nr:TfoX family protein [Myxococcales bacterium]